MGAKQKQDDGPAETPAWIVSFADMITLLLAFFVLLQSFAKEQDPDLFRRGQGAFIRSIDGLGIPDLLFGKPQIVDGPQSKTRYQTDESDDEEQNKERVIDPNDARIRNAFELIKKAVDTDTSEVKQDVTNVLSTSIEFAQGSALLNAAARKYLQVRAGEWGRDLVPEKVTISIVALAPDEPPGRARWVLSSRRAQAVAEFVKGVLGGMSRRTWLVVPMGAGVVPPKDAGDRAARQQEFVRITITRS